MNTPIKQQAIRAYPPMIDNSMLNNAISSLSNTVNNHADMIDTMYAELKDLKGFYQWIIATYPEHIEQYRAILDLQKAGE
jgi:hypothetical protein